MAYSTLYRTWEQPRQQFTAVGSRSLEFPLTSQSNNPDPKPDRGLRPASARFLELLDVTQRSFVHLLRLFDRQYLAYLPIGSSIF
jgi:hypothetical protein